MRVVLVSLLGIVAVAVAAILVAASFQPKEFRVARSVTSAASAPALYAVFSDLSRYGEWSPWQRLDPGMKTEFTGERGAVGSAYGWDGNDKVGAGRMTIVAAEPDRFVDLKLEFQRPWEATNKVTWRVDEDNGQRRVTWSMEGVNESLVHRAFALVMNMDKMVGDDFEKGLASLKDIAEKGGTSPAP